MNFVFDLDGTICFKGQPVSDEILNSLVGLTKEGHRVIFASARPIRDMLPVIREDFHHYTMIGGNGSLIAEQGKITNTTRFPPEELYEILRLINELEATYLIDGEWNYAYTGPNNHPILQNLDPAKLAKKVTLDELTAIVKILILTSQDNDRLAKKLTELDVYVNKHANESVLDISPKDIHKWSALQKLGIRKGSYVAFGNDSNDMTMFENARHTVMIGYHEELARIATESITSQGTIEQKVTQKIEELSAKFVNKKR